MCKTCEERLKIEKYLVNKEKRVINFLNMCCDEICKNVTTKISCTHRLKKFEGTLTGTVHFGEV